MTSQGAVATIFNHVLAKAFCKAERAKQAKVGLLSYPGSSMQPRDTDYSESCAFWIKPLTNRRENRTQINLKLRKTKELHNVSQLLYLSQISTVLKHKKVYEVHIKKKTSTT